MVASNHFLELSEFLTRSEVVSEQTAEGLPLARQFRFKGCDTVFRRGEFGPKLFELIFCMRTRRVNPWRNGQMVLR